MWSWAGTDDGRTDPDIVIVIGAINNARRTPPGATRLKAWCEAKLVEHADYVVEHLEDMPDVRDWVLGDWAAEA